MKTDKQVYHSFRIVLPDGRRIYLSYNAYLGPFFFHDRHHHRPIAGWLNDQAIIHMFFWFINRGCKA